MYVFAYLCVCLCVCLYLLACICFSVCAYLCMCVSVCLWVCLGSYVCCAYVSLCVYLSLYAFLCCIVLYMHVCVCICVYVSICVGMYVYICTYMCSCVCMCFVLRKFLLLSWSCVCRLCISGHMWLVRGGHSQCGEAEKEEDFLPAQEAYSPTALVESAIWLQEVKRREPWSCLSGDLSQMKIQCRQRLAGFTFLPSLPGLFWIQDSDRLKPFSSATLLYHLPVTSPNDISLTFSREGNFSLACHSIHPPRHPLLRH